MDGWWIGYDEPAAVNPRLVYAAGTVLGADDATPVGVTIGAIGRSGWADAQNHLNGYLIDTDDPQAGASTIVGTPVRLGATPTEVDPAVPELGQHTEEILLEIGYDRDDIARFRQLGAI